MNYLNTFDTTEKVIVPLWIVFVNVNFFCARHSKIPVNINKHMAHLIFH